MRWRVRWGKSGMIGKLVFLIMVKTGWSTVVRIESIDCY